MSRNVKLRELDRYQLKHKKIPKDTKFFDEKGLEEKYFIVHDTERGKTNHFFPIIKQKVNGKEKLQISETETVSESHTENDQTVCSLSNINESLGNSINHYRKLKIPRVIKNFEPESEEEHSYSQISETSDSEDYNDFTTQTLDSSELETSAESVEGSDQNLISQNLEIPDQALQEEISFCRQQF